jgi:hypothetical protein
MTSCDPAWPPCEELREALRDDMPWSDIELVDPWLDMEPAEPGAEVELRFCIEP